MIGRSFRLAFLIAAGLVGSATAQPWSRPASAPAPLGLAGDPPSEWRAQQDEARAAVRAGRHVPLGRVIEALRARTPGRQLDTALERGADGRPVYRVRWAADNGRRIDYRVDAETGAILSGDGG